MPKTRAWVEHGGLLHLPEQIGRHPFLVGSLGAKGRLGVDLGTRSQMLWGWPYRSYGSQGQAA